MPERVQLSRKKGWKLPPNTVKVARPGPWGNPFRVGGHFMVGDPGNGGFFRMSWCESFKPDPPKFTLIADAAMAVEFYRRLLANGYLKNLAPLRGRNLACWCALDAPCHADVLLDLANNETKGRREIFSCHEMNAPFGEYIPCPQCAAEGEKCSGDR